jgi:hypothetical protein
MKISRKIKKNKYLSKKTKRMIGGKIHIPVTDKINSTNYWEFYGCKILQELTNYGFEVYSGKDFLDIDVDYNPNNYKRIILGDRTVPFYRMTDVFKHCYLGLRLTPTDGNANGVVEAGLLGIKSIHNGKQKSSINYKNIQDILDIIEQEKNTIGSTDHSLSKYMNLECKFDFNVFNLNKYFEDQKGLFNRFEHLYISDLVKSFKPRIQHKIKFLKDYKATEPTIFFGAYTNTDINNILDHKSYGLIIFAGGCGGIDTHTPDAKKRLKILSKLDPNRFAFIAISNFIENDLKNAGIKYHNNLFYFGDYINKKPVKKGNCIFMYLPQELNKKESIYYKKK